MKIIFWLTCVTQILTSLLTPEPDLMISPFKNEVPPLKKAPIKRFRASSKETTFFWGSFLLCCTENNIVFIFKTSPSPKNLAISKQSQMEWMNFTVRINAHRRSGGEEQSLVTNLSLMLGKGELQLRIEKVIVANVK